MKFKKLLNKFLTFSLSAVMLFSFGITQGVSAGNGGFAGSGTADDPYLITSPEELVKMSELTDSDASYASASYKLTTDLDMSGISFKPISKTNFFGGTFDGDYHKISNLTIENSAEDALPTGFISRIEGGTLKNLGIESGSINGGLKTGALAGYTMRAVILNCYSKADVTGSGSVGALAGFYNNSDMYNCYALGTVTNITEGGASGALVAETNRSLAPDVSSSIVNCYTLAEADYAVAVYDESWVSEYFTTMHNVFYSDAYTQVTGANEGRVGPVGISAAGFTDGTLLSKLNANLISGCAEWRAGEDGYPEHIPHSENTNMLPNSEFETEDGGVPANWEPFGVNGGTGSIAYVPGEGIDGSAALKVEADTSETAGKGYAARPTGGDAVLQLESNSVYTLSFYIRRLSGNAVLKITARQMKSQNENTSEGNPWYELSDSEITVTGNEGEWQYVTCKFTTHRDTAFGNIWLRVENGSMLFDNVSLEFKEKLTENLITIHNLDFERANGNVPAVWVFNDGGDANITWDRDAAGGRNGSAAVHVKRAVKSSTLSNINSPDIKVEPETEYVLEFWMKSQNVTNIGNLNIMLKQKQANGLDSQINCYYYLEGYEQYGDTDWKKVTVPFTTASDAGKIDLFFHFVGDSTGRYGSTGEYWIDDINIRTKEEYDSDTEQYAGMIEVNVTPTVKGLANGYYKAAELNGTLKSEVGIFADALNAFENYVKSVHGLELSEGEGGISLVLDESFESDKYKLICEGEELIVKASSTEGINYALSTVLQIMKPNENGGFDFPICDVTDYPDTEYRSLMSTLHVGEHREGVVKTELSRILDYIDLCYLNKINYLHFDFNQYGYYALPSEAFPELPTDGHYTKEDIAVMNAYAKARGITIIPAINAPGHCSEFMIKYPDIFGGYTETGYYDTYEQRIGILDCSEESFEGLRKIYEEVCELFPDSPYIHLGGDEAPTTLWHHSEKTKAYAKEHGFTDASGNMDLKALYTEFIYRTTEMLLDMGRTPIVWEGFPASGNNKISKDVIVAEWECAYNMPWDLIEAGYKFTNVSWQPLYIASEEGASWDYKEILKWNIYNWQHFYEGSAALGGIVIDPSELVIGAEMPVWRYRAGDDATYTEIMERLPALAQKTWNIRGNFSFNEFAHSLELNSAMLKKMNAADRSEEPALQGDVNCDGAVDIRDLIRLKKITAGISPDVPAADMNLDSVVNAEDIALLKKTLMQ